MLNLSKDKRKSLGSFYTPDSLADEMGLKMEVEKYKTKTDKF